jgi:hypothetical protein
VDERAFLIEVRRALKIAMDAVEARLADVKAKEAPARRVA